MKLMERRQEESGGGEGAKIGRRGEGAKIGGRGGV